MAPHRNRNKKNKSQQENNRDQNDKKRQKPDRDEEDSDMDPQFNSTKKWKSENLAHLNEVANNLKNNSNPTMADIVNALGHILTMQIKTHSETAETNEKISGIKKSLKSLESDVEKIKDSQKEDKILVNEKFIEIDNKFLNVRSDVNYLMQSKVDNDVLISGFYGKPDESYAVPELLKFYDMPEDCLSNFYSYTSTQKGILRGTLVITFKSKSDQLLFREKKISKGPVSINQLTEVEVSAAQNTTLGCFNRLTPTNQHIQRELGKLLEDTKIKEIKYRNCQFFVKIKENSALLPIGSVEHLNDLKATMLNVSSF